MIMDKYLTFLHPFFNNRRCHARITKPTQEIDKKNYIGTLDGYEIYKTYNSIFTDYNSYDFVAIKKGANV